MKNFAVPESFSNYLSKEIHDGRIDKSKLDLRSFFQYVLEYSSKILYNTEFDGGFSDELINYIVLLYGGQDAMRSIYIRENISIITENILKLIHDINMLYCDELFSLGKYPVVLNASIVAFTVEYSEPNQN